MTVTTTLPADLWGVLRRMRGTPVTTLAVGRGAVECRLGGCPVDTWLVAALIARGLVAERELSGTASEYTLTPAGRELANEPEARA
jgi:hypothetical protein